MHLLQNWQEKALNVDSSMMMIMKVKLFFEMLCFNSSTISNVCLFHGFSWHAEDGIYLAYADFHSYLLADAACMKELNQWFSKQLDTVQKRLSFFSYPLV